MDDHDRRTPPEYLLVAACRYFPMPRISAILCPLLLMLPGLAGPLVADAPPSRVEQEQIRGEVPRLIAELDGDQFEVLTDPSVFADVTEALEGAEIATLGAEVALVPTTYMPIADPKTARSVMKFVEDLEENDDVQNVYTNMDVADDVLKELGE